MIENLRSKVLTLNDLPILEEMLEFIVPIRHIMYKVIRDYTHTSLCEYQTRESYYPLIRQARQMSIHSILCHMAAMLADLKKKRYFTTCNKVYILNHFLQTLTPSEHFLEKFLVSHPHFHVEMPPPPKPDYGRKR